jgi:hypothetical protein
MHKVEIRPYEWPTRPPGSASHGRSGYCGDGARNSECSLTWTPMGTVSGRQAPRHSPGHGFGASTESADYRWSVSEPAAL